MIKIDDKRKCCACEACRNSYPVNCIKMESDEEGFAYPKVDEKACIHCGKCTKVCPILNESHRDGILDAYAMRAKDEEMRLRSSSGGAFSLLAHKILDFGGIVFGVIFDENLNVIHASASNKEELKKMNGSKYVQSIIGDTYREAEGYLKQGKPVCFSGTPCQIEGLKTYLGKEYENLYTVDVVCLGVPSPKIWDKYKLYMEKKHNSKMINYTFRSKKLGFHKSSVEAIFENGNTWLSGDSTEEKDFMRQAFYLALGIRPSCHHCQFKTFEKVSDFTMFDCFNMTDYASELEDDKGASIVFVHTEKGMKMWKEMANKCDYVKADLNQIKKSEVTITFSIRPNKYRDAFFKELDSTDASELMKKYMIPINKNGIKYRMKKFLRKFGIFNIIKRTVYKVRG